MDRPPEPRPHGSDAASHEAPGDGRGPEVELDVSAFLPEGTALAAADDGPREPEGDDDDWGLERPAPEPPSWARDVAEDRPGGSTPGAETPDVDPSTADLPTAPEAPASGPTVPTGPTGSTGPTGPTGPTGSTEGPPDDRAGSDRAGVPPDEPGPTAPPTTLAVDLSVLEQVEADLVEVDAALTAIDAGDPARSPLLARLLDRPAPD